MGQTTRCQHLEWEWSKDHRHQSPTLGAHTHAHGFWMGKGAILLIMGGHGCDFIGNIIGNVTIFEYMGALWIAWVGMGGHRSLLMGVVWAWVQIWRKCWALIGICRKLCEKKTRIHFPLWLLWAPWYAVAKRLQFLFCFVSQLQFWICWGV